MPVTPRGADALSRAVGAPAGGLLDQMIREIIEPEGHEVVGEATNGVEAVDLFKELAPDLVTMDIVMPKRSGIDAVKRILADHPTACVVMCSALGQESLVMEALQAGARDFIVKPFKPDSVIATLKKVLEKAD